MTDTLNIQQMALLQQNHQLASSQDQYQRHSHNFASNSCPLRSNHLTGGKTQSSQPISWLVLVNKIKQQPNYNINNINDTVQITINLFKQN